GTGGATRLQGLGVVYGGTVNIQGVTAASTTGVNNLRYIEGTGVLVSTPTTPADLTAATGGSTFSGSLTLVGNGAGISYGGYTAGVLIWANLTTSNGGDLSLVSTGTTTGLGIYAGSSTLTAGGAMILTQSGSAVSYGIYADSSTLTAGGDLSLLQTGTVGSAYAGIILHANGTGVSNAVSLTAGGLATHWITLKTNNQGVLLFDADNFRFNRARLRIDLGTGTIISKDNSGTLLTAGNGFTLDATGLDVFYTGASTGNNAKIKAGSFTVVTTATGNQTLAAAGTATVPTGLTVTDSAGTVLTTIGVGYATTGVLTIDGTTSAGYRYLEGATISGSAAAALGSKITGLPGKEIYAILTAAPLLGFYSGTAPSAGTDGVAVWRSFSLFANDATADYVFYGITAADTGSLLTLDTSGKVTFNGNSTFARGLKLKSSGVILKSNTTVTGGDVRIDLGGGVFNGGTFTLTANGQNLYYTGATTGNSGTIAVG
ncbi:MAG: hypothetical protein ORO03_05095, partial [Alphaproteobacteria bacterium]|nr:hypothetical protein [Alphaproteobacteria bacterium]